MRLWSLHPSYLDARGLVALWREALLAKAVLEGRTRGYRRHPQLERFRACSDPASAINAYLQEVAAEADRRGYRFDRAKVGRVQSRVSLRVSSGQLGFELAHLRSKLEQRAPLDAARLPATERALPHPLFTVVPGPVEAWERGG